VIDFGVFSAGQVGLCFLPPHAVAFKGDAVRIVDDPIEDCVCDSRFSDHVMPLGYGELCGYERRFPAIAFLEDFQQVEALLIREGVRSPIVEDQQLDTGKFIDQPWKAAIEPGKAQVFEQTRHAQIQDGMIEPGSLTTEGAGKPGFSRAGLAGDDHVLMSLQPCPLRKRQSVAAIETTMSGKVDVLDAGVGKAELRCRKPVGQALVGSQSRFPIEHQAEPLVAAEITAVALSSKFAIGRCHSGKAKGLHLLEGWVCQHRSFLSSLVIVRSGNQGEIRIASPKSVPKEQCRCLTRMFSIASPVVPEI
jgi:hypothetical protein